MRLHIKCAKCSHVNALGLDDLLGKFAVCAACGALVKIGKEEQDDSSRDDRTARPENDEESFG